MIAGIDFSTKAVDVVLLDDESDAATWHRFGIADPRGPFFAARNVRAFLPGRSWWEEHGVWLIGIEDPHSRFPHVAKALGMVAGALAARLPQDVTVVQTAPKEWKRIACGNANASKEQVALAVIDLWENMAQVAYCDGETQDTMDAYGIAYAVRKLNADAIAGAA